MFKTLEEAKRLYIRVQAFCNRILSHVLKTKLVQYLSSKFCSLSKKRRIFVITFIVFCSWFIYSKCIFRFENFNDGKKTEEYLRKRFPKGYKVKALVKLIERAGGECRKTRAKQDDPDTPIEDYRYWLCYYEYGRYFLNTNEFRVLIEIENEKIKDIQVHFIDFWL